MHSLFALVASWIKLFLIPDTEWKYWWIVLITIPLTFAWMWFASNNTRRTFNNLGPTIVFGSVSLAILLGFVAPFLGALAILIGVVSSIMGLSLNLSIRGIWNTIKTLFKLIPFFLVIWLISKIPGLEELIEKWVSLGKDIASRVWNMRQKSMDKPSLFWTLVGGLLIALLINGKAANLMSADLAFPGLIPCISAAIGLYFLFLRTVMGRKLVTSTVRSNPKEATVCPTCGRPKDGPTS